MKLILCEILFIVESGSSFYSSQLPTFRNWMKDLGQPLLDQKFLIYTLMELTYRSVRLLMKKNMGFVKLSDGKKLFIPSYSSFSITFDGWTDIARKNSFIAITRHWFCDEDWKFHSGVFDVIPFQGSHTAVHLAREIAFRLQDTSALLYCGIVDNGANMVKACKLLLNNQWDQVLEDGDLEEDFEEIGFRCQDHTMDLFIRESVEEIPEVGKDISCIRKIVVAIKSSTQLQEKLHDISRTLQIPSLSPILDVRTRWNSVYFMLERFSVQESALAVLFHQGHFDNMDDMEFPSSESLQRIPRYIFYLKPFEAASRFFEGQKYVTIAHVPFILSELQKVLLLELQEFPIVESFRSCLQKNFWKRFSYIFESVNESLLAAALHPCYGHLSFLSDSLKDMVWRKLQDWAFVLLGEENSGNISEEDTLFGQSESLPLILQRLRWRFNQSDHKSRWHYAFQLNADGNLLPAPDWKSFYEEDERGEIHPGPRFTSLHPLVKMIFSLPATTAPSERVFSCSGFLKPARRSRISPYLLEYLTVIRSFIQSGDFIFEDLLSVFSELVLEEQIL